MRSQSVRLAPLLAAALLAACATPGRQYDSGAVTHRMVTPSGDGHSFVKYFTSDQTKALDVLKAGDSVSIRINAIYMCDFTENNPFPQSLIARFEDAFLRSSKVEGYPPTPCSELGIRESKHYTRGEIVVLADVYEQGSGRTIAYSKDGSDAKDARVVFYDDDVRESGQFFSLANIPVYGPIRYAGNALFFRIFILELDDDENTQNAAMLKKLAELGSKAYPPASPVLQTLSSVGDALLSGEQDDLEFRYTMSFDPHQGTSATYLPLAVGNYVMVKQENRSQDFEFSRDGYENDTGELNGSARRKVTFISFKVSKNEPALQQDGLQIYSEFEATLPAAGVDLAKLDVAATAFGEDFKVASLLDQGRAAVHVLNDESSFGTPANWQADASLRQLICESSAVLGVDGDEANPLRTTDIDYLLRSLDVEDCLLTADRGVSSHWITACQSGEGICKGVAHASQPPVQAADQAVAAQR